MRIVGIRRDGGAVEVAVAVGRRRAGHRGRRPGGVLGRRGRATSPASRAGRAAAASPTCEFVPPVLPGARVICIGLNYLKHVAEGSFARPGPAAAPDAVRPLDAVADRRRRRGAGPVERGRRRLGGRGRWPTSARPLVDADPGRGAGRRRRLLDASTTSPRAGRRSSPSQWILGKNGDNSGPLGPMVPAAEVGDLRDGLRVQTRVNGEIVQDGRTDEMVYTVGDTLSLISHTFTLRPGDLLATGTPSGVGYARTPPWLLQPGRRRRGRGRAARRPDQPRRRQLRAEGLTPCAGEFRQYLFPHDHPRVAEVRGMDPYTYGEFSRDARHVHRRAGRGLDAAVPERVPRRHRGRHAARGPVPVRARPAGRGGAGRGHGRGRARPARRPGRRRPEASICFDVDAVEWQTWANPEFLQFDTGLRLDLQPAEVREKALALMRASLSPRGLRAGPRDDADQRVPRRGRRPRDGAQRVQLQHRPLRRARPARARGAGSCSATTARSTAWWSRAAWWSRRCSSAPSPTRSTPARTPGLPDVFADRIELGHRS